MWLQHDGSTHRWYKLDIFGLVTENHSAEPPRSPDLTQLVLSSGGWFSSEITGRRLNPFWQLVDVAGRIRNSPGGMRKATRCTLKRARSFTVNRQFRPEIGGDK
jgi:hypothetical protein